MWAVRLCVIHVFVAHVGERKSFLALTFHVLSTHFVAKFVLSTNFILKILLPHFVMKLVLHKFVFSTMYVGHNISAKQVLISTTSASM